jgi:hypothetical protein
LAIEMRLRVLDPHPHQMLGDADAVDRHDQAFRGEPAHGLDEARARAPHQVLRRHLAVVEEELRLEVVVHHRRLNATREAGRVRIDQQERAAPVEPGLGIGHHEDLGEVAVGPVGDEVLLAVDDVAVAPLHRGGADGARIRAGAGLGQREAGGLLTAHQGVEISELLVLRQFGEDHGGAHRRIAEDEHAQDRAARLRDGLPKRGHRDVTHAASAQVLRHVQGVVAERHRFPADLGTELQHLGRDSALGDLSLVPLLQRQHLLVEEALDRLVDLPNLFGKREIHQGLRWGSSGAGCRPGAAGRPPAGRTAPERRSTRDP